jgi:hypothetical protein
MVRTTTRHFAHLALKPCSISISATTSFKGFSKYRVMIVCLWRSHSDAGILLDAIILWSRDRIEQSSQAVNEKQKLGDRCFKRIGEVMKLLEATRPDPKPQ